jgi:hypothetical protein
MEHALSINCRGSGTAKIQFLKSSTSIHPALIISGRVVNYGQPGTDLSLANLLFFAYSLFLGFFCSWVSPVCIGLGISVNYAVPC